LNEMISGTGARRRRTEDYVTTEATTHVTE
jgi:hypothetical protein